MTSPGPKLGGNFPRRVQNWGVKNGVTWTHLANSNHLAGFSLFLVSKVMKNPPNDWNLPSFETKSNEKPAKSNFGCLPKRSFLTPWPFALNFEQNVVCECSFLISMSS